MSRSLSELIQEAQHEELERRRNRPSSSNAQADGSASFDGDGPACLRKEAFAREFLFGKEPFNASSAYRAVHPNSKAKDVRRQAARYMADPDVHKCLRQLADDAAARNQVTEDFVMQSWYSLAKASPFDFFVEVEGKLERRPLDELTIDQQRNVRRVRIHTDKHGHQVVDLELHDRGKALENLATVLGMMGRKTEEPGLNLAEEIREAERRALRRSVEVDRPDPSL